MGAKHYKELTVWQLGDALREEVCRLTASGPAARDFKFCSQLREAAGSIPSNIAEGFKRSSSIDYARFVTYSFTSLDETEDRLKDGLVRRHWTAEELERAKTLIRRITPALRNFLAYLLSDEARERSRALYRARGQRRRRT
jgi:four helix bundle protein